MRTFLPIPLLLAACHSSMFFEDERGSSADGDTGADVDDTEDPGGGGGGGGSEVEDDRLNLRPAETEVHVFIANPDDDSVTRVNVGTLEVKTVDVGDHPTLVRTTHDQAHAVVFNEGDDSVTVIDAPTLQSTTVDVRGNLNSMAISPDSRWALLWHDMAADDDSTPGGGAVSYNEMSIVEIDTGVHHAFVVGFSPEEVAFTPDGRTALAIADAWLATIDLSAATPTPTFLPIADPLTAPPAEELEVAYDGSFAFIRQGGVDWITVVNLDSLEVDTIPVGANPTDLDLTEEGDAFIVVSRDAAEVAVFDVSDPFAPPVITPIAGGTPLGSILLAPDDTAVLFTNAALINRYATWTVGEESMLLHPLPKPAQSMSRTPTGTSLMVVHDIDDNPDGSTPLPYRDSPAISLISLADQRTNTLVLDAPVGGFANAADGRSGYVILTDAPWLEVLDYVSLTFEEIALRSDAVFVGVLPDLDPTDGLQPSAWTTQDHPLGRITFYDPDDASTATLTGFALNGEIED